MTDNLRIWSQVDKTDPAYTKKVNQRGGFTAISAAYQIKRATEVFGPIGIGWGYTTGTPIVVETLLTVPVSLWHGDRANVFGPMLGCEEWKDKNGRVDSDAPKKAVTDGLTKLLSQLGFNADVFLGRFDDSKYVAEMEREFAAPPPAPSAAVSAASVAIGLCATEAELTQWSADNKAVLDSLEGPDKLAIRRAYSDRLNAVRSETPFDQKKAA